MVEYSLIKESDTHFIVLKDGVRTYNIVFKQKNWSCDCPARKTCKHLAMLPIEAQVKRYPRAAIKMAYDSIAHILFPYRHSICGSYRRGSADSKDIDIIVLCDVHTFEQIALKFNNSDDFTYISGGESKFHGTVQGIPIDIDRVDNPNHYAAHLLYRTGPASLNIKMRQIAKSKGWILNEFIYAGDEAEIFEMCGMEYIPPDKRS